MILSDGTPENPYGYYLKDIDEILVGNNHPEGVAFQTKSNCQPTEWPLHLRMKVKMEFYE